MVSSPTSEPRDNSIYSDVLRLFLSVREADSNKDGRLDDDEMRKLTSEQQSIWKRRSQIVDT